MFFAALATIENEQERLKVADIYKTYRNTCLRFALSITRNQQMAEDAVQDAFIEIIKRKEKYLPMKCSDLLPSIVIIVKHRALNILKKQNRQSDIPIEDLEETFAPSEVDVAEQVAGIMGFERLIALVSRLNENYKTVFEMKYVEFMPNEDIARVLGITQKNVEQRLYRAKTKLKEMLGNEVNPNV